MAYVPYYIDHTDLENAYSKAFVIETADDDKDGSADTDVVLQAIKDGESIVNGFLLAGGYTVPVATPIPEGAEIIQTAAIWFALAALAARRNVIPDEIKERVKWFMDLLKKVADKTIVLPLPTASGGQPHSTTLDQQKIFVRSKYNNGEDGAESVRRNTNETPTIDII